MKRIYLSVLSALTSMLLFAQEKSADVDININKDGGGSFWGSPAVWIVGVAVFIIVLVAVSRSGSRQ